MDPAAWFSSSEWLLLKSAPSGGDGDPSGDGVSSGFSSGGSMFFVSEIMWVLYQNLHKAK
jgi:hypothetical protein